MPALVLSRLEHSLTKSMRTRGEQCARSSTIRLKTRTSPDEPMTATVVGTYVDQVTLSYEDGELLAGCSCPYFDKNYVVCKHIWATLIECEKQKVEFPGAIEAVVPDDGLGEDSDDFDDFDDDPFPPPSPPPPRRVWVPPSRWRMQVGSLARGGEFPDTAPLPAEITWILDPATSGESIVVEITSRTLKKNGELGKPQAVRITRSAIARLPSQSDREILAIGTASGYHYGNIDPRLSIGWPAADYLIPKLVATGRLLIRSNTGCEACTTLDAGDPWRLAVAAEEQQGKYVLVATLRRGAESIPVTEALAITRGFVIFRDSIARFADDGTHPWAELLRRDRIEIPAAELDDFVRSITTSRTPIAIDFPPGMAWQERRVPPRARLELRDSSRGSIEGIPRFDYDGRVVDALTSTCALYDEQTKTMYVRDEAEEARLLGVLWGQRFLRAYGAVILAADRLLTVIPHLIEAGWEVRGHDGIYAGVGELALEVRSGIDWFDVEGVVSFGEEQVRLPSLLAALRKGESSVRLSDGRLGLLRAEWSEQLEPFLAAAMDEHEGGLRFRSNQVVLLDALLATRPEVSFDDVFEQARRRVLDVQVVPEEPEDSFRGELRPYQREGLGWFSFLRGLGFGGCLADDMGLGKTVQVLALLDQRRRTAGDERRPALVVAPRSVVFNWKAEAARFTPDLRVLDHSTPDRIRASDHFAQYDLVLTTYALLRKEVALFDVDFDYVILDEAQAIKNPSSQAAKAATLLRGRHRLALSGTPVENHLGELASLFEFLNPGMLRAKSARVMKMLRHAGSSAPEAAGARATLARAMRPFILRRTKTQVAPELPERTEQTIWCELEPKQRKLYDELRDYYRASLLGRVKTEGLNRSKIHILEALLRMRQAACHPGLVDPTRDWETSAKLDALFDELRILVDGGHKVLVFSQFTSLLSIVRRQVRQREMLHAYIDGASRDREAQVERFQNDPDVPLFLISLKAGGLGLNLTAAEYVFLLDPWWNPAVEAQAIDRAHRIGQSRNVFAYRLVARDTIEEKILQLQQTKRALADAIISEENSILRQLTPEDLDLLLS